MVNREPVILLVEPARFQALQCEWIHFTKKHTADGLTCNFDALYIGIVKFMFTGPASFVIFPAFHKGGCHNKLPNRQVKRSCQVTA